MDKKISLDKTYLNSERFKNTVDTSINFFITPPEEEQPTVEDFFELYEELYLEIPTEGEINSHRYLVQQSSELLDVEEDLTRIQPLLDEITQLREQLLEVQRENVELKLQLAQNA